MSEKLNYWLAIAGAGVLGSSITAVGNAFGFSRRIKNCEDSGKYLEGKISECYTKKEQDDKRIATMILMQERADHHAELLSKLEVSTEKGLAAIFGRLNNMG